MSKSISVVIPAYRNPTYLDLCLRSAIQFQSVEHEYIVIADGYVDELRPVLQKYPQINVVEFEENRGETVGHNTGVTLASCKNVLIVNADNVFPPEWDHELRGDLAMSMQIIAPNQIEPRPSIFPSFVHAPLGDVPEEFDVDAFVALVRTLRQQRLETKTMYTDDGGTWPVFMSKLDYMALGGIDSNFPHTPFADWDFFLRAELLGFELKRSHFAHFYHFANAKITAEQLGRRSYKEYESAQYYEWKWGHPPTRNPIRNSRFNDKLRGL
jgi:glycosyltransferase involved in cell wall biosynthesis